MTCLSCGFQFSDNLPFCPKCATPAFQEFGNSTAGDISQAAEVAAPPATEIAPPPQPTAEQPAPATPEMIPAGLAWSQEPQPAVSAPPSAPVASSPPPERPMPLYDARQAAAYGISSAAEAAKHAAGIAGHATVSAGQAAATGLSHAAEAAKQRFVEAGGIDGVKNNAKSIAEKSGAEAKIFFENSYERAKPFVNAKNILTAVIIALSLVILLIMFAIPASILLAGFSVILMILIYIRVHMAGHTSAAKMQTLNAVGYTYLLTARGEVYRIKDGVDISTRLDISGAISIFSDNGRIFACKRDGSLVTALHGSNGAVEILPAGTVLCGKADASADGFVYFSSAKVRGNPVCRVRAGGGAVHIVTE